MLVLAQPPWSHAWLATVALVPLLVALRGVPLPARALLGWLCGTVWSFAMVGTWLGPAAASALDSGVLVSFGVALVATQIYGGLHLALFAVLAGPVPGAVRIAVLWVAIEVLRSASFGGVPWGLLGHSLWSHPTLIQVAALLGVAGVSFWLALINASVAEVVFWRTDGRSPFRLPWRPLGRIAVVLALVLAYGRWRLEPMRDDSAAFAVQVVHSDWEPLGTEGADELHAAMMAHSRAPAGDAEFIVWPEAALRVPPADQPESAHQMYALSRDTGRDLIFGAPRAAHGALYNSMYVLSAARHELVSTYDKRRLVPLAESRFRAGAAAAGLRAGRRIIAPLLCFEALFADLAVAKDGDLFVNPSNDVRVGHGAEQQAAMAVFRAVENGIPLLRVANRGPTLLVGPRGRILHSARGWGSEIWQVPAPIAAPPFRVAAHRWRSVLPARTAGDGPFAWACLAFTLGSLVVKATAANRSSQ